MAVAHAAQSCSNIRGLISERVAEAEGHALEQSARLRKGADALRQGHVGLGQVFRAYLEHRAPRKSRREQAEDQRRADFAASPDRATPPPHSIFRGMA